MLLIGALIGLTLPVVAGLPSRADTASAPGPVTNLTATVVGDQAIVSWTPPSSGGVARYEVSATLGVPSGQIGDYGQRIAGPSATSLTWDRVPFNTPAQFTVVAVGADTPTSGSGPTSTPVSTGWVETSDALCPPGTGDDCVVVAPNDPLGPEDHVAAGLNHGETPAADPLTQALGLTHWRADAGSPTDDADVASYVGASNTIDILSDPWFGLTEGTTGYAEAPWVDWPKYTAFIEQTVTTTEAAGQDPLWDIENEPENYPYDPNNPPTRALVEQQYLVAYNAIKTADPDARVIGPSINWAYENPAWPIDMKTFIPFAAANGMQFYALSWHDNGDATAATPQPYIETPQSERDHAEEVRELIAENPGIGTPQLFVDEDTSSAGAFIPGFAAGYVAEAERAGVNESNRSCWPAPGAATSACFSPILSDLLNTDGSPNNSYWVMQDYASMTGSTVWSETSDTNVSSLAVTDSRGTTRVLLGRHQTCSWWTIATYCPAPTVSDPQLGFLSGLVGALSGPQPPPGGIPTTVDVTVPPLATAATVAIEEIPDSFGDMGDAPTAVTSTVTPVGGVTTFTIPSFGDGEAYFVTVAPNVTTFPPGESVGSPSGPPTPPVATTITPVLGMSESTPVLQQFPTPLQALVADQYGQPMGGVTVTFSTPSNYVQFPGGASIDPELTDTQGIATSQLMTAQLWPGTYTATASIPGAPTAGYSLTVEW